MGILTNKCPYCDDEGQSIMRDETGSCSYCNGTGRRFIGEMPFTSIEDKIQEVKTKINQMQADINYIKAKVG